MKGNSSLLIIGFEDPKLVRVMSCDIIFKCLPINNNTSIFRRRDIKEEIRVF